MSNTAGSTSGCSMKGFSVLQPSLGAPLSWMPAVGTKELEQLINAYLPGPASAQEKRAAISLDFFEFTAQTGENFKYYPVPVNTSQPTGSPASSAVSASPALSSMSYGSPSQPSTPAPRTASRTSAVKAEKTDYSHLPGMKILTTDGQDVTNSVSRGCKSKEQREHAHLMRVLKACDACKKKKVRCDPSHKRRSSSQVSPKAVSKPAKKTKKSPSPSASQATTASFTSAPEASLELGLDMSLDMDLTGFPPMDIDDILAFNPEPIDANLPQDFYGAVPQDFDFFLSNDFSPAMASSTDSFDSPAQPLTPVGSGLFSQGDFTTFGDTSSLAFLQAGGHEPSLPYMTPDATHGSNYVDFNLYSPASSFIDEEPQKLKAGEKKQTSAQRPDPTSSETPQLSETRCSSSDGLGKAQSSTGLANNEQSRVNCSESNTLSLQESQRQDQQGGQLQQVVHAGDQLVRGVSSHGDQRPYHGDNGGHNSDPAIATVTRPYGLVQAQPTMRMSSPATAAALLSGMERTVSPTESLSPVFSSASAPVSPLVSPHMLHQDVIRGRGGAHVNSRTISPSELHAVVSSPSTPLVQSSTLMHTSPIVAPSALEGLTPRRDLLLNGGLPVNSGLVVAGGLQHLTPAVRHTTNIDSGSSPSTVSVLAPREVNALQRVGDLSASAAPFRLEVDVRTDGIRVATTATTASTSGLGLQLVNNGDQRQALQGVTVNHNDVSATRSSPRHKLPTTTVVDGGDVATFLPVRQWLGQQCIPSGLLTHQLVAVFGLVSMLLIMGLTTSLLHHLQSPILAHLLSSSSYSSSALSSWVFLSCLSISSSKQDVPDTAKSIRCPGWQAMAGPVKRMPLAAF